PPTATRSLHSPHQISPLPPPDLSTHPLSLHSPPTATRSLHSPPAATRSLHSPHQISPLPPYSHQI
ncbi:uncharacterized protein LOC142187819, partial [Leptodactylus fuscus]|uniref:uncharacterized protein LOC142187819 n=1 Tax=Leptodactylus fuscus TaxID=238119 RepID=UPI003F4EF9EF